MNTKANLANKIVEILRGVIKTEERDVPLHRPCFTGNEWAYLKECLDSTFVSSVGKYVDRFEEMLAGYVGMRRAVAVVNGTSGLQVALKITGVQPGDEVLLPALTFVATANAVKFAGATPHLVDSEERTLGLDPYKLGDYLSDIVETRAEGCHNRFTGNRLAAVLPVHTFGHPVDLDPLKEVCDRYHLRLIEDATESMGSLYKGKHTGEWGEVSVFSFNGNKIITTGGGGALLTNDEDLAKLAKHLTTTAKIPHQWDFYHDRVGFNYRMPNINAALGCAQMEQLPVFVKAKRDLAMRYASAFSQLEGVRFFTEAEFARSNYWLNVLLLDGGKEVRDEVLEVTNSNGLLTRPAWMLMHKLPMYRDCPRMDLSVAESLEARLINIPSSVGI